MPINHNANQPSIIPIIYHAYQQSCLSAIMPIGHSTYTYQQPYLLDIMPIDQQSYLIAIMPIGHHTYLPSCILAIIPISFMPVRHHAYHWSDFKIALQDFHYYQPSNLSCQSAIMTISTHACLSAIIPISNHTYWS